MRELIVKGIGKAAIAPDLIVLNMSLEVTELEYEKTMLRGTETLNTLRASVVSAGHDGKDLKTSSSQSKTQTQYRNSFSKVP